MTGLTHLGRTMCKRVTLNFKTQRDLRALLNKFGLNIKVFLGKPDVCECGLIGMVSKFLDGRLIL